MGIALGSIAVLAFVALALFARAALIERRRGSRAVSDSVFEEALSWWMMRFVKGLQAGDAEVLREPVAIPLKKGTEYIITRVFGDVEGTIFLAEPPGPCQVLITKRRGGEDGWSRLKTYRRPSVPVTLADLIVGVLTGKIARTEIEDRTAPHAKESSAVGTAGGDDAPTPGPAEGQATAAEEAPVAEAAPGAPEPPAEATP